MELSDRHTDILIAIFRTPVRGEEMMRSNYCIQLSLVDVAG